MDSTTLFARSRTSDCCPKTGPCPVTCSVYGYQPSLAATVLFLALFAISGIVHLGQGFRYKTWFFSIAMTIGCLAEVLGYISKMLLWKDPFSNVGFKMSLVMLTIAPAFYSAGIYYTLKHIFICFGAQYSRLRPALYTYVFVSCDLVSIFLQALGGGIAAASKDDATLDKGDHIMVAGLALQVATLVIFGLLVVDFAVSVMRDWSHLNRDTAALRSTLGFKSFLLALTLAYLFILIRCAYRVAELTGGWSYTNAVLRNQGLFIGLDSTMCLLATVLLNIWHPGWCFPKTQHIGDAEKSVSQESYTNVVVSPKA